MSIAYWLEQNLPDWLKPSTPAKSSLVYPPDPLIQDWINKHQKIQESGGTLPVPIMAKGKPDLKYGVMFAALAFGIIFMKGR